MQVEVAKSAGFCFGVKRSIDLIEKTLAAKKPVFLLSQPIHNPVVIEGLKQQGAKVIESLSEVPDGATVVIRAHGEIPETFEKAREKKLDIIDCACPFVTMVQKKAKELAEEKYVVIIVGEKNHPEVLGIKGNNKAAIVVENAAEAEALFQGKEQFFSVSKLLEMNDSKVVESLYATLVNKVGVVSQTTQTDENFSSIVTVLAGKAREVRAFNTICNATHARQPAAAELAEQADVMVVIGGKNSGNTLRLFEISKKACEKTHWVETAAELKKEWFSNAKKAGITAGASTPPKSIEEVKQFIEKL